MPKPEQALLKLRQLDMFLVVAKHTSFAKAAEELGISAQALSLAVRELEESLGDGVKLFERNQRGARLSRQGDAFLPYAKGILEQAEAGKRALQGFRTGVRALQVSYVPCVRRYVVPAILSMTRTTARLDITAREVESDRVYQHLSRGSAELGITFLLPDGHAPDGYEFQPIVTGTFWCVTSPEHRLAGRTSIKRDDLKDERLVIPWVHSLDDLSWLGSNFVSYAQTHELWERYPDLQVNSIETALRLVKEGHFVALMPELDKEDREDVVVMPIEPTAPPIRLGFAWKQGQDRAPMVEEFAEDVRKRIMKGFGLAE